MSSAFLRRAGFALLFAFCAGALAQATTYEPSVGQEGKVRGEEIVFTAGGIEYKGRINGNRIEGDNWTATRS